MLGFRMLLSSNSLPLVTFEAVVPSFPDWMEWDITNYVKDAISQGLTNVDLLIKTKEIGTDIERRVIFYGRNDFINNRPIIVVDNIDSIEAVKNCTIRNNSGGDINFIEIYDNDNGRGIISFPIVNIINPNNVILKMLIWLIDSSFLQGKKLQVYRLIQSDWVENQATWNNYKTDSNWISPGGDYTG